MNHLNGLSLGGDDFLLSQFESKIRSCLVLYMDCSKCCAASRSCALNAQGEKRDLEGRG